MKKLMFLTVLCLYSLVDFAQQVSINNFIVKENLLKNSKIAIIAADSLSVPLEAINGDYTFSVSGFTQTLDFNNGVAVLPLQIERSTFVYLKHQNEAGTHSKLVYVYKNDSGLKPYTINSWWLVLFPIILVVLAFTFRKFIIVAVILFLVFLYFNHSNGLNLSTFFETIFDGLKRLF